MENRKQSDSDNRAFQDRPKKKVSRKPTASAGNLSKLDTPKILPKDECQPLGGLTAKNGDFKPPSLIMFHKADPAQELRNKVGDISKVEILHNQVLVAVYIRPEKTASGIFLADQTRAEDRFQGKAGLVLKKGPLAFVDDATNKFHGQDVHPGEWIFYRVSDGFPLIINGQLCRLLEEVHIKGKIPSPDVVY